MRCWHHWPSMRFPESWSCDWCFSSGGTDHHSPAGALGPSSCILFLVLERISPPPALADITETLRRPRKRSESTIKISTCMGEFPARPHLHLHPCIYIYIYGESTSTTPAKPLDFTRTPPAFCTQRTPDCCRLASSTKPPFSAASLATTTSMEIPFYFDDTCASYTGDSITFH